MVIDHHLSLKMKMIILRRKLWRRRHRKLHLGGMSVLPSALPYNNCLWCILLPTTACTVVMHFVAYNCTVVMHSVAYNCVHCCDAFCCHTTAYNAFCCQTTATLPVIFFVAYNCLHCCDAFCCLQLPALFCCILLPSKCCTIVMHFVAIQLPMVQFVACTVLMHIVS